MPGARGQAGYSPLIELPRRNGAQRAADRERLGPADKVVALDTAGRRVVYRETNGFQGGRAVRYVSTDASDEAAAALEDATYAPALNAAPPAWRGRHRLGPDEPRRVRQRPDRPRQPRPAGTEFRPSSTGSTRSTCCAGRPTRAATARCGTSTRPPGSVPPVRVQRDWNDIEGLVATGDHRPGGAPFGPAGFIVDCPIVSRAG